jgi:hypothetical protein
MLSSEFRCASEIIFFFLLVFSLSSYLLVIYEERREKKAKKEKYKRPHMHTEPLMTTPLVLLKNS